MRIRVAFDETDQHFAAEFQEADSTLTAEFGKVHVVTKYVGGDLYEGDYAVTPKVSEQTLPTKGKYLIDDITLRAVPVFRVSNSSGGTTVYIAKEV